MGGSPSQSSSGSSQPSVMPSGSFGSTSASPTFQIGGAAPAPSGTFGTPTAQNPFQVSNSQQTPTMANASLAQPGGANPGQTLNPGQVPPGQIAQVAALLSGIKPAQGTTSQTPQQLQNMVSSLFNTSGNYA